MSYADLLHDLDERLNQLSPQRRAAVFWLVGTGLRRELDDSEGMEWKNWFENASRLSVEFILGGRCGDAVERVLAEADNPAGDTASQLLNSAIICLSSSLEIALNPEREDGPWIEPAFFPIIQKVSLDMFEDVVFPGEDDELEEVVADSRVQQAAAYCAEICEKLYSESPLDRPMLDRLLDGADVLTGSSRKPR